MPQQDPKEERFQIRLPLFISAALAVGILLGATLTKTNVNPKTVENGTRKFSEILTNIEQSYVDSVNQQQLVKNAIEGMLKELDPHTAYIPADDRKIVEADLKGNFEGIGIEFNIFKDTLYVVAPLSGGPSEKAGLRAGDRIIKVDGHNIAGSGLKIMDVHHYLRGSKGSEVQVTVLRPGHTHPMHFEITRDEIPQYSIDASYMLQNKVGYVKISRFAATTSAEFKAAVQKLKKKGMQKLIIDLQDNPGGYLDQAVDVADQLLTGGKMIVYTKGRVSHYDTQAMSTDQGLFEKGPLILLVNEGTASAAEILSGAVQDNDRGLIVGRRTFGKGLVQMPITLKDGSELRLTISRYYTPSGRCIQKPYTDNLQHYEEDMVKRYEHGEYFHADSVHFNDSLKYHTSKGRLVYGGGGIMPDYFVPLDTTQNSGYLNQLFSANILREFTLLYYNKHRDKLDQLSQNDFQQHFVVNDDIINQLKAFSTKEGVPVVKADFQKSEHLIKLYIKAFLARSIWNNEGFYPIFNQQNEILQQADHLFGEAEQLALK